MTHALSLAAVNGTSSVAGAAPHADTHVTIRGLSKAFAGQPLYTALAVSYTHLTLPTNREV